ncbi:tetratricopeptide repeat protein [Candidatus Similichlamydia epinepheli]|uniref:tetratricopeptide repeat protein n=1 Tax=Candidatus Similichlamydia epinepheli TaxID=1903953 RepID=UPI000D342A54|nr:tetratricopeptide repeat protein [Candidatus Similichlamydia epinepheli]
MNESSKASILRLALEQQNFSLLERFKHEMSWLTWSAQDRELFAEALVYEGRGFANESTSGIAIKMLDCFELASRVAPMSHYVAYLQGQTFWSCYLNAKNICALSQAVYRLRKALEASSLHLPSLHLFLRVVLAAQSFWLNSTSLLQEAYDLANPIVSSSRIDAETHLLWAELLLATAKNSGEIGDYAKAIRCFSETQEKNANKVGFWISYGDCVLALSQRVASPDLLYKAEALIARAINLSPESPEAWLLLARFYTRLLLYQGFDDSIAKAEEAFSGALARGANRIEVSLQWAELYYFVGRIRQQVQFLRIACDKLQIGLAMDPANSKLRSLLSCCQTFLGSYDDNLTLLRQAENVLLEVIDQELDEPVHHYRHALVLLEQGKYFCDSRFFQSALARLKTAVSQVGKCSWISLGLAQTYSILAETTGSVNLFKKCLIEFSECSDLCEEHLWINLDWAVALMRASEVIGSRDLLNESLSKFSFVIDQYQAMGVRLDAELLYQHGCALDLQGDYSGDESFYDRAVQSLALAQNIEPNAFHIRLAFAFALSHLAEATSDPECFFKAFEHYRILSEIDPEDDVVWGEWGLCILAFIKSSVPQHYILSYYDGHLQEAEEKFLISLRLGNQMVLYNLAGIYAVRGDLDKALKCFSKAVEVGVVPSLDEVLEDNWLEPLRNESHFLEILSSLDEGPYSSDESDDDFLFWTRNR